MDKAGETDTASERFPKGAHMKYSSSIAGIFLVVVAAGITWGQAQRPTRASAWEELVRADPEVVDDSTFGWRERLILHVLSPDQADRYFQKGADPQSLLLDNGQTLKEYLDAKLSPPAGVYIALATPCRVFSSDQITAGQRYGIRVRGDDLAEQGGSSNGCGIPAEATAAILELTLEYPEPGTRLRLWAADGPEPAESALETANVLGTAPQSTVTVTLSTETELAGDLMLRSTDSSPISGQVVGYFRAMRAGDGPSGGVSFYTESGDNNFFGVGAGTSNTGSQNSFFGANSGVSANSGDANSFFGFESGYSNTTGGGNAFFGASAGFSNTSGNFNSFFGGGAGHFNSTGTRNAFFGNAAGWSNTTGSNNAFFGYNVGLQNTTGYNNSFFGDHAGYSNTVGSFNSFFGRSAGESNTTGSDNAFVGDEAGRSNTSGTWNAFFGDSSGYSNTTGTCNSFFGGESGTSNTTGSYNAFFGEKAGFSNTTGHDNTFFGVNAGHANTNGSDNAFFGRWAGTQGTTGVGNSFIGHSAGDSNTVENFNTCVGESADIDPGPDPAMFPVMNATALGSKAYVAQSDSLVLGSIAGLNGATDSVNVGIGTPAPQARFHVENTLGNDTDDIVMTSTGKLGLGTVAPANGVHVKGDAPGFIFEESDWGNQKWQMAALNGEWRIRDLTGGNVYPFRVAPGIGGTALMINPVGNVGIGTDMPAFKLHVIGSIFATGGVASSRQLKDDIAPLSLEDAAQTLLDLEPVQFRYKDDPNHDLQLGFIAEDVSELVSTPGRTGVQPMDLIAVLVKTAQDQQQKLVALQQGFTEKEVEIAQLRTETDSQLEAQEAEIRELRTRLQEMEQVRSELAEIRSLLRTGSTGSAIALTD
jgi:hypothetical protein